MTEADYSFCHTVQGILCVHMCVCMLLFACVSVLFESSVLNVQN